MKILAVDYGDSRTGLATCDRTEFLTTSSGGRSTRGRSERPRRPCGKVSLRSPDSLLQSPQKIVVFRFVFTIFLSRICIVFRLDSTCSSPIK